MSLPQVNLLNIGLMLASVAAAFALPFEVFLFSYAVLGPLHYLTELSWLHDRKYFVASKLDAIPLAALCLLLALGAGFTQTAYVAGLRPWATEITFLAFGGALVLVLSRDARVRTAAGIALVGVALLLRGFGYGPSTPSAYRVFFTVYLATVVHVFVFTGAFILLGALRSSSTSGLVSFGVFLASAAACFLIPKDLGYVASRYTTDAYSIFGASVNRNLVLDLHLGRLATAADIYTAPASIAVTRFIAYAYTYHYLNWFSKTSIIRWHEVPRSRFVAVGAIWIASLALYAANYRTGIQWLFFLSLLHVFLEFPLNHRSFMDIGGEIRKRVWRPATAS